MSLNYHSANIANLSITGPASGRDSRSFVSYGTSLLPWNASIRKPKSRTWWPRRHKRAKNDTTETPADDNCAISINPTLNLKEAQRQDPGIAIVIELKMSGKSRPKFSKWSHDRQLRSFWYCYDRLFIRDGLLVRSFGGDKKALSQPCGSCSPISDWGRFEGHARQPFQWSPWYNTYHRSNSTQILLAWNARIRWGVHKPLHNLHTTKDTSKPYQSSTAKHWGRWTIYILGHGLCRPFERNHSR